MIYYGLGMTRRLYIPWCGVRTRTRTAARTPPRHTAATRPTASSLAQRGRCDSGDTVILTSLSVEMSRYAV